jgi:hypothetical protein
MNYRHLTADIEERAEAGSLHRGERDLVDIEYLAQQITDEERRELLILLQKKA